MVVRSKSFGRLVEAHEVVQRVVERAQVGVDLLREIARQEAQALACFHRGTHEHDPLDRVALERVDGARDREICLAGTGGPMPKVMSWLVMSLRYATWLGVRPCRSARRVRSGGDSIIYGRVRERSAVAT